MVLGGFTGKIIIPMVGVVFPADFEFSRDLCGVLRCFRQVLLVFSRFSASSGHLQQGSDKLVGEADLFWCCWWEVCYGDPTDLGVLR